MREVRVPIITSFKSRRRYHRNYDRVIAPLVPDDEVRFDGTDDDELDAARGAALAGRWMPAARLLAADRQDAALHQERMEWLATMAGTETRGWLDAWLSARPDDPDALTLHGCALVHHAWEIRGGAADDRTDGSRLAAFRELVAQAEPVLRRATRSAPLDATPWAGLAQVGLGVGYPAERMREILTEVESRAPGHYSAHRTVLQYFCPKWWGTHEELFAFARSASDVPAGHPLRMLPVQAWFEYADDQDEPASCVWSRPEAVTAVDRALEGGGPSWHPAVAEDRSLLAYALYEQSRYLECYEQFRIIGGRASSSWWSRVESFDGPAEFLDKRSTVAAMVVCSNLPADWAV
ncbi:hypothetical protein P8605_05720 [Streptomyces sp. T-3]|nr:hypothetical protein [Streptomyces sp. T-3]